MTEDRLAVHAAPAGEPATESLSARLPAGSVDRRGWDVKQQAGLLNAELPTCRDSVHGPAFSLGHKPHLGSGAAANIQRRW